MIKKKLLALSLILIVLSSAHSQTAGYNKSLAVAQNWLKQNPYNEELRITDYFALSQNGKVLAHCFELHPAGYIVVTNDFRLEPVIAYSFTGAIRHQQQKRSPLLEVLHTDLRQRYDYLRLYDEKRATSNLSLWHDLIAGTSRYDSFEQWPPEGSTSTGGWLETNWKQSAPYNALCPMDNITGVRSVAGCPAVALAMIINYQKNLNGTRLDDGDDYYHNYAGRQYWIDDDHVLMDFPSFSRLNEIMDSIEYKYPLYLALDDEEKAALVFACGVAAQQVYTSEVSGTFGVDQAYDAYMRFGNDDAVLLYDSDTSFYTRMKNNIKNGMPVHLALLVDGGGGGHNVVADGYNTDDFYHLNFGWGGSYNGWYLIPEGIPYNLTIVEGAIMDIGESHVGIRPDGHAGEIDFTVYPNPTRDRVKMLINISRRQMATLELYDQKGTLLELIYSGYPGDLQFCIEYVTDLPSGMYNLVLRTKRQACSKKLIITK